MSYIKASMHCPRLGRADYLAGKSLSANPYVVGTFYARMWADGWLNQWMVGA